MTIQKTIQQVKGSPSDIRWLFYKLMILTILKKFVRLIVFEKWARVLLRSAEGWMFPQQAFSSLNVAR